MVFAIIGGIFSGFILGVVITLYIKVKSVRQKIEKSVQEQKIGAPQNFIKAIEEVLADKKKEYLKDNEHSVFNKLFGKKSKTDGQKSYFKMLAEVVSAVATTVNPQSPKPIYEFSVKRTFEFIDGVTYKIEEVLNYIDLPLLKQSDIGGVFGLVRLGVKFAQNPVVKGGVEVANKTGVWVILRLINPVAWINALITAIFTSSISRDLSFAALEVVAWQALKLYLTDEIVGLEDLSGGKRSA